MDSRLVGSLSREARLLLLTAAGSEQDAALHTLLREEIRWPVVLELARREGASAVLWQRVHGLAAEIPAEVAETLRRAAWLAEFRQAMLEQRLGEALTVLSEAEVSVMLLKGAALVCTVYGSFAARPMADLDLLVDPARAAHAQQLLIASGWKESVFATRERFYRGHQHLPPLEDARNAGASLELHTDLFFRGHPFPHLLERMWESAAPVRVAGASVLAPHTHHQLVHLCLHYAWSHMLRAGTWRTFRDLRAILGTGAVAWEEVLPLARETQASSCCYWTLRLAWNLGGVSVPEGVLEALRPPLAEPTLATLERHFAHEMLASESLCPSVRLSQAAWRLAIQPEWSGHGRIRPWDRETHFSEGPAEGDAQRGGRKLLSHLRQLPAWGRYLTSLLGTSSGDRRDSYVRVAHG